MILLTPDVFILGQTSRLGLILFPRNWIGCWLIGDWLVSFSNTAVEFLERGVSDHSSALVTVAKLMSYGPKPFKYFNFWSDHKNFLQWVEDGWRTEVDGFSMFRFYSKLKSTKTVLKAKNREFFGGLGQKVMQARANLESAQAEFIASQGSADCQVKERECLHLLTSLLTAEENFLKQNSRVKWLNLGDGNTSFFHNSVTVRNSSNLIKMVKDEHGHSFMSSVRLKGWLFLSIRTCWAILPMISL